MSTERVTLSIDDLRREGSSAMAVLGALVEVRGVVSAAVNLATESAYVEFDPAAVCLSDLAQTVGEAGFKVTVPFSSLVDNKSRLAVVIGDGTRLYMR